jgi:hypothetical protein
LGASCLLWKTLKLWAAKKMELCQLTLHRVAFPAVHYISQLLLLSQDAYLHTVHVTSRVKHHLHWYLHLLE